MGKFSNLSNWKKTLIKYSITTAVGLLMMVGVFAIEGLFSPTADGYVLYKILCDGFFVPGAMLIMFGILVRISGAGGFDALSYVFYVIFVRFVPSKGKDMHSYGDYKAAKTEKRKGKPSIAYLYIVGGAFVTISLIFLILFYVV